MTTHQSPLRKIRKELKLAQPDISKKLGIRVETYRQWELERISPSVFMAYGIVAILNQRAASLGRLAVYTIYDVFPE